MKSYKKSFAILFTILLITAFSFLSIYLLEIKTFHSDIHTKQYLQIQSKFHLDSAKDFINNLNLIQTNKPCVNEIKIANKDFDITANIEYISNKKDCLYSYFIEDLNSDINNGNGVAIVNLYVSSKSSKFKIRLHQKFLKKL